jgi:hypothetical protein
VTVYCKYTPKIGDHVSALGQSGTFEVTAVDTLSRLVSLRLVAYDFRLDNMPWPVLKLIGV